MVKLTDIEYLRLNWFGKAWYLILRFFCGIPNWFVRLGKSIWNGIKWIGISIKNEAVELFNTFWKGSWVTKVSFLIMGFGSICRGQILRGLLFMAFEAIFIYYMATPGKYWLGKFGTLGDTGPGKVYDPIYDAFVRVDGDDSFKVLLYGLITIFFIVAFIYTWRLNVKQNMLGDQYKILGKPIKRTKDDIKSLLDEQFYKTLLALPITGILIFTVMPIIFMILVAFTNYDGSHDGYSNLFTWIGMTNFNELFAATSTNTNLGYTFGEILSWTLIWSIFATFTNYFLGMLVAIMINKRGIKIKKFWRSVLVLTIAIPQFVSLLYVSRMFANNGIVNGMLMNWGWIDSPIQFWKDRNISRIMVIVINIWIGIPYLMLIATGILMNIPADLYESARIDGANIWQQYMKITLPYMLFVTGPYLLNKVADIVTTMNPETRLFYAAFDEPTFINQRLIGLKFLNEIDHELCHALLNSILEMFFTEACGFGRGLGVLDLNSTIIENSWMLNPNLLNQDHIAAIKRAFEPLKERDILPTLQELEMQDRIEFDHIVLSSFGIDAEYENIKNSLLSMQNTRLSVKE